MHDGDNVTHDPMLCTMVTMSHVIQCSARWWQCHTWYNALHDGDNVTRDPKTKTDFHSIIVQCSSSSLGSWSERKKNFIRVSNANACWYNAREQELLLITVTAGEEGQKGDEGVEMGSHSIIAYAVITLFSVDHRVVKITATQSWHLTDVARQWDLLYPAVTMFYGPPWEVWH